MDMKEREQGRNEEGEMDRWEMKVAAGSSEEERREE